MREQAELERLWSSNNPQHIREFYALNPDVSDLVKFSRHRPKAAVSFARVRWENDHEIVAVVPTTSVKSKLAQNIAKALDPLPILFVESSGQFFNFSRSLNLGFQEALKVNPSWIVYSNDDMFKIDPVSKLVNAIRRERDADCLFATPGGNGQFLYHTIPFVLSSPRVEYPFRVLWSLLSGRKYLQSILWRFALWDAYGVRYVPVPRQSRYDSLRILADIRNSFRYYAALNLNGRKVFINFGDFGIFKSALVKKEQFDETYINSCEDVDFSYRLQVQDYRCKTVDFSIGSIVGASLNKPQKGLRDVLGDVYFFHKHFGSLKT